MVMRKFVFYLIVIVILHFTFVSCNSKNERNVDEKETVSLFNIKTKPSLGKIKKDIIGLQIVEYNADDDALRFVVLEDYIKEITIVDSKSEEDGSIGYDMVAVFQRDGGAVKANLNILYIYDKYDKEYKIDNFVCKDLSYVKTDRYNDDVKHAVVNPIFGPNYMSIENDNYKPLIVSGRYSALGEWIEFNVEIEGNAEAKIGIFVDEYEIYFIERPF